MSSDHYEHNEYEFLRDENDRLTKLLYAQSKLVLKPKEQQDTTQL